jgi:GT2 family glycosyltransferase
MTGFAAHGPDVVKRGSADTAACLTVVIVNYRTPRLVVACVDRLKTFPATSVSTQIIVVDNGSNDGSLDQIAAAHPDVVLIDGGANHGFAKGNNLALRGIRSGYVMLINSDALVEAGAVDGMIAALRDDPAVGAVGPRIINVDDDEDQDYPRQFPTIAEMIRRALFGPQFPARGHSNPVDIGRIHGACLMTRAEVLQRVGVLDEAFFMYDEDVDWCIRVRRAGWKLRLLPSIAVRHYGGKTSGRKPNGMREAVLPTEASLRMRYELRRSRYLLYLKHRNPVETALLKVLTDAALSVETIYWLITGTVAAKRRSATFLLIRHNIKIIRINPFRLMAPR